MASATSLCESLEPANCVSRPRPLGPSVACRPWARMVVVPRMEVRDGCIYGLCIEAVTEHSAEESGACFGQISDGLQPCRMAMHLANDCAPEHIFWADRVCLRGSDNRFGEALYVLQSVVDFGSGPWLY